MNSQKLLQPKPEFIQATIDYLNLAYKDYLAARVLFNAHLPIQGSILASTAIEKYFKAILSIHGALIKQHYGHLKRSHIDTVKSLDPKLFSVLNAEFMELLEKAYSLRYLDNLPDDFNLVIASREFLAELDFSAFTITEKFNFQNGERKAILMYHFDRSNNDTRLLLNNHVLGGVDKQAFISAEPQAVYEIRKYALSNYMESTYFAAPLFSDGKFMRSGFTPKDSHGTQFNLAFMPLPK